MAPKKTTKAAAPASQTAAKGTFNQCILLE